MSETEKQATESVEETTTETTEPVEAEAVATTVRGSKKSSAPKYAVAVLIVAAIILGVLYMLEKEGRSSTNLFASLIASQEANAVVAVVNGEDIVNSQLTTSVQQFSAAASSQGVDTTSPEAQADIRDQALEVLINTELLKQAAVEKGIAVSDEAATERLATIVADIGGEEVLETRMEELGVTKDQLHRDIKDELLIQRLLDAIFLESEVDVSEEEIAALYEGAGGEEAGLPALEEVREQIVAQIRASKEQAVIDEYLAELKSGAEIEVK